MQYQYCRVCACVTARMYIVAPVTATPQRQLVNTQCCHVQAVVVNTKCMATLGCCALPHTQLLMLKTLIVYSVWTHRVATSHKFHVYAYRHTAQQQ
eukprot:16665-Heterococcus_DN1.PRE.1